MPSRALLTMSSSARAALAAVALAALLSPSGAAAAERCSGPLSRDVCAEATGVCPAVGGPIGLTQTDWPVYQHDVQHTGKSLRAGPACADPRVLWRSRVHGRILSPPVIGPAPSGQQGNVYIGASKNPICSIDPAAGEELWCDTNEKGRDVNYGVPVLGNDMIYVGTRDNDLWAIDIPTPEVRDTRGTVNWRQKVCTDGDVTGAPIVGPTGLVYFGSDSLEAGTLFAMCPGSSRQVKWCKNPVGGPVSNVSPALSPDGTRLYATFRGSYLGSYDAQTGDEKWRIELEKRRNNGKTTNFTPVVNPSTGRVYVGFDEGLFAVDTQVNPSTQKESPVPTLLFPTLLPYGMRVNSPPAIDVARGQIYFGATRSRRGTLFAIDVNGQLKWSRELGKGIFRANPPVIDANGRIYVALYNKLFALDPANGNIVWEETLPSFTYSSPVITPGRIYIGTKRGGYMYAIGCS